MSEIVLDFETASFADLSDVGSNIYAKHITTEILSLTFTIDDGVPYLWTPLYGHRLLLKILAEDPENMWICHNAGFEKDIWREIMVPLYGFPDIPNERWHDILASCALRTIPLALDNALHTMGLTGKDMASSKFTRNLSKPDKHGTLDRSPETMKRVYDYNEDDVLKERELHKVVGYLPPAERKIWLIDQEINERGVKFDLDMIRGALKIYEDAKQPLLDEFRHLTGINPTQVAKFKDWLSFNGLELANMRKETVNALLGLGDDDEGYEVVRGATSLPDIARRALTIRALVGSASVKKFARMEQCADPTDWRIRRLLQYHGAGTGRWAGRLFNAHNMPRGLARVANMGGQSGPPDPELLAKAITSGQVSEVDALGCFIEYGDNRVTANPIEVLASALRSTIIADEGKYLLIGDWSAIEARLILAIAGQHDKTTLMASGVDVYLSMAEQIFNEKGLTKADVEKRQTGKNTILGRGFQMGDDTACQRYIPGCVCRVQGVVGRCQNKEQQPPLAARSGYAYRKEWAPEVPKVWKALGDCALQAVQTGRPIDTGYGITYRVKGLWLVGECMDGSDLYYYRPTLCRQHMSWSTPEKPDIRLVWRYQVNSGIRHAGAPGGQGNDKETGGSYSSNFSGSSRGGASGQWVAAYGGLLTENYIQHMARQLLARALGLCRTNGLPVILHNQDEIIVEHTNPDVAALKQIMEDRPRWATLIQLPLAAECHPPCKRYHK